MPDAAAMAREVAAKPPVQKQAMKVEHSIFLGEAQMLLAEKRTAYALLRTGVSVSLVPLSLWTALIATSKLWNPFAVLPLLAIVMLGTGSLLLLGLYLILRALAHSRHADRSLAKLRASDTVLEGLLLAERPLWRRRAPAS